MRAHYLVKLAGLAEHRCQEVAEFIAERANAHAPPRQERYERFEDAGRIPLRESYYAEKDGRSWVVRSKVPYWHYVEFGTLKHGDAQPHVRLAVREAEERYR